MRISPQRLDELISKMQYKAKNITTKMEPEVFEDVAYCLEQFQQFRRGEHESPKFLVGDFVVYKKVFIGIVLKTWWSVQHGYSYDVYIRSWSRIQEIPEEQLERYRVRHKELNEEEMEYQRSDGF